MSTTEKSIGHIPTLGPNGIVPQSWYESEIKIQEVSYVWVIHHFRIHHKKLLNEAGVLKSTLFPSTTQSKSKWHLQLEPDFTNSKYIYLSIILDDTSECKKTFGKCKISFYDENRKVLKSSTYGNNDPRIFSAESDFNTYFKINEILPSTDKFTIYCELTFSEVDPLTNTFVQSNSIKHSPAVPELRLVEDIRQLFGNEEFADFVVSVKDKYYKVHKTILIARSPVFAAMLKHENLKESQHNAVDILDFDEEVVEEMLRYIYTGKLENLETLAEDLLAAAEKYGLDGLKTICESALAKKLSIENAIEMFVLADLHDARSLKSSTMDFIVAKYSEVMKSAAWKNIAPSYPQLLIEVCEALSRQMDCKLAIKNA